MMIPDTKTSKSTLRNVISGITSTPSQLQSEQALQAYAGNFTKAGKLANFFHHL